MFRPQVLPVLTPHLAHHPHPIPLKQRKKLFFLTCSAASGSIWLWNSGTANCIFLGLLGSIALLRWVRWKKSLELETRSVPLPTRPPHRQAECSSVTAGTPDLARESAWAEQLPYSTSTEMPLAWLFSFFPPSLLQSFRSSQHKAERNNKLIVHQFTSTYAKHSLRS